MRIYNYKCVNKYCNRQWTDTYIKKAMTECPHCGCQIPPEAEILRIPDPIPIPPKSIPMPKSKKERKRIRKQARLNKPG